MIQKIPLYDPLYSSMKKGWNVNDKGYQPSHDHRHHNVNSSTEKLELRDYGPRPLVINIDQVANYNQTYRTALWTGKYLQVTLMSIQVGVSIPMEQFMKRNPLLCLLKNRLFNQFQLINVQTLIQKPDFSLTRNQASCDQSLGKQLIQFQIYGGLNVSFTVYSKPTAMAGYRPSRKLRQACSPLPLTAAQMRFWLPMTTTHRDNRVENVTTHS